MSGIGTGYDLSCTTFSPDGRIFQVEYAGKAVDNSGTAVGVRCKDGVVMGVEKLTVSKMLEPGSNRRVFTVDNHAGLVFAGLSADARQLVNRARAESKNYKSFYYSPIPGKVLCERLSGYVHLYTLYAHLRPFGCSVILGTYSNNEPQLYMIEPSGVSFAYYGAAIGKAKQAARGELEKLKLSEMTCKEAVVEVAKIIHMVHDEVKDKDFELELSWICPESNFKYQVVPKDIAAEAERVAKAAKLASEDMEEDK